jgi:hypothetical protein
MLAAVACGGGVLMAWLRVVPAMIGFGLFALGGVLSLVAALWTFFARLRGHPLTIPRALSLGVSIVFVTIAALGSNDPAINDFTTDPDDPPAFVHAGSVPANEGRDLVYPAEFASIQRECCADLRGSLLDAPPAGAYPRVLAVARSMPTWEITFTDPATGAIEAVATTLVFGFQDDIVIRVRPAPHGGSRVDLRSKSRDGRGDIGANAARIRAFIRELEKRG